MASKEQYQIGGWRFDVAGAALLGDGGERRLEDRAARTLTLLCRDRGEVVSHADLLAQVWHGRAVSPNSIAVVIADLRRSLDDDARDPVHIATVAKRGYRLNPEAADAPVVASRPVRKMVFAAVAAVGLAGLAAFGMASAGTSRAMVMLVEPVANDTGRPGYDPLARALSELVTNRVMRIQGVTVIPSPSANAAPAAHALRISAKLILWNGEPTLSLTATDRATGAVAWAGMAAGPADALAGTTIAQIDRLGQKSRTL